MMGDVKTMLAACEEQEKQFQFAHFSRQEALEFGLLLHKNAAGCAAPVALEITINGLVVFRCFPDGAMPDSELWLQRKRNTVDLMQMSSLHFLAWLEANGETVESRKLPADDYAAGGGGFPITLKGTGCIGSICVSGLPDHHDDHQLIINTLAEWFTK